MKVNYDIEPDDLMNQKYIKYMCSKCKFYEDRCTKKRLVLDCARKGLKNKEEYYGQ